MSINTNLFSGKKHHFNNVVTSILEHFKVQFTISHIHNFLNQHIQFPSLLALKDAILQYGVQSKAIRKGSFNYFDFETPFVCSIQQDNWSSPMFTVVNAADEKSITYLDPIKGVDLTIAVEEFERIDKEIILLLDGEYAKDEVNYSTNRKNESIAWVFNRLPYLLLAFPIMLAGLQFWYAEQPALFRWSSLLFTTSSFFGLIASILLLWYEIDAYNPFLKEVCGGGNRNVNCNAVLNSESSKFINISWSVWGFAYFASFFAIQCLYPGMTSQLTIWSASSVLVSPYILYSIYYQWRVIKKWCPLCLGVQAVLLFNVFISVNYFSNDNTLHWDWYSISLTGLLGFSFLVACQLIVPMLKKAKDSTDYERKWKKMRYDTDVFNSLLQKSEAVTNPVDGLGIVIGDSNAAFEIVKVCNPYCGPCAKAHPVLEEVIRNNPNIKLRVIFTATGENDDMKTAPVSHLLAIHEKSGNNKLHQALNDWYLPEEKNYEIFANKYPIEKELLQQGEKMRKMREWCNNMKIRVTPTIYLNGKELPESYHVADLKYILLD